MGKRNDLQSKSRMNKNRRSIKFIYVIKYVGVAFFFLCSLLCLYIAAIEPRQVTARGGILLVAVAFLYIARYLWRIGGKN